MDRYFVYYNCAISRTAGGQRRWREEKSLFTIILFAPSTSPPRPLYVVDREGGGGIKGYGHSPTQRASSAHNVWSKTFLIYHFWWVALLIQTLSIFKTFFKQEKKYIVFLSLLLWSRLPCLIYPKCFLFRSLLSEITKCSVTNQI